EGRGKEIQKLTDWLNDDDERTCLVFGDGGFGKTTLVLEFINRLFEEKIPLVNPRPLVISFYSAKMTRWTEHGLIHIKSVAGAMDECIRELIRGFEPVLSKDWYEATDEKLVQKAINYLKEEGVDRND
ncbi:P-loop NTPase family protein, partial [Vibrio parahaemolyticus]|uniref:ATP-binding protein n=3 Tax=Vibrio harveyi group TaxID=717610 RepID=UPI001168B4D3